MKTANVALSILFLSMLVFSIPSIPKVHASPNIIQSCEGHSTSATTINCTLGSAVTAGHTIIVTFQGNGVGGGVTTISGGGLTYGSQVSQSSGNVASQVYSAPDAGGGALTVTGSTTGAAAPIQIIVYDVAGIEATATATATGVCAFNCVVKNPSTSSSITVTGTFAIAALFDGGGAGPNIGPTNSFTFPYKFNSITNEVIGAENSTSASGSTNFLMTPTAQGNVWTIAAATFGPTVSVTTVVACTFFQLQCWWYPMLFFGVGLTPFMLVGGLGKVNARSMTYLLLCGLTFTAMVEVLMGLINVMFPLIFTVLTIVYAVRIK